MNPTSKASSMRLLALALLPVAALALAQRGPALAPPAAGDLVVGQLVAGVRTPAADVERRPLEFFQPLAADTRLEAAPPHLAESREYWQRVDGDALRAGYALALTAPGAVVLVSPAAGAEPLVRSQLAIDSNGSRLPLDRAGDTLVDAQALRAAGMEVAPGSVGFRLRPGFEADAALVVAGALGDYVLHVFEPASRDVASARAQADTVHAGGTVQVQVALAGGGRIEAASGVLVSPAGQAFDVDYAAAADGGLVGTVAVPAGAGGEPGLWDLRTSVAASGRAGAFQRDVRIAVAVVAPVARLNGEVERAVRRVDGALELRLGIEVASAGRYELRGVLHGSDGKGARVALGLAQAAAWLEPGTGTLALAFPVLSGGSVSGPFELRDLQLVDQTRIAVLERRALALRFD